MSLNLKHKKTIIFDFDGTLANIEPIFIEIFNALAPEFHFTPLSPEDLPILKQLGAREFLKQRLPLYFWQLWRLIRRGKEEYQKRMGMIQLFPGIVVAIEKLQANGYQIGIISSSASTVISELLHKFGLEVDFLYQSTIFGKHRTIREALRKENLIIDTAIYIGDEVRDVQACHKVGLDVIAVTWGLNTKEALIQAGAETIDTPEELLSRFSL